MAPHMIEPWKRNNRRKPNTLEKRKSFLILCQGKETEVNYFNGFNKLRKVKIEAFFIKSDSKDIIEKAIIKRDEKQKQRHETYDEVWCVFDKDNFPEDHISHAFAEATKNNINIAYSNKCFELWFLLHFSCFSKQLKTSNDYSKELTKVLSQEKLPGGKYRKNRDDMFTCLNDRTNIAITNAKLLCKKNRTNSCFCEPYTTVHLLVNKLIH